MVMSQRKCQSGGTQYDLHPPGEILRGPVNLTAGLNTLKNKRTYRYGKDVYFRFDVAK